MYARLSILRPFIVAEANRCVSVTANDRERSKSSSNIMSKLCKDLCKLCVTIAHDTIEELHKQISTVYRTSPWHTLYCKDTKKINPRIVFPESRDLTNSGAVTFAAASVLVAATLCPSLEVKLDRGTKRCKSLHSIKRMSLRLRGESRLCINLEITSTREERQIKVSGASQLYLSE
jgi:hypothetical protein